jgi:serine protease inhibitor
MKHYGMIFVLLAAFVSCNHNPAGPTGDGTVNQITPLERKVVDAGNSFGFKLFTCLNKEETGKNIFISPFSVSMAFGMLLNGAKGPTLDSLEKVLGDAGMSLDDINAAYKNSSSFLTTLDAHVSFQIANSIWYTYGFSVLPNFLNVNKNYFDAEVDSLDFMSPGAPLTINNWVNTKTNGKIPTIIDGGIPLGTVMYLVNAIYFKGAWTNSFNTSNTKDASFTCGDGSFTTCKMMSQNATFAYYADNSVQAIDLPYSDRSFSMTVLLPAAEVSIDQYASALTQGEWNTIINNLDSAKVELYIPKFILNYSQHLSSQLKSLGMGIVFDYMRANLTGISKMWGLCVTDVLHKSYVNVDEEGTEAAAVTSITVGVTVVFEDKKVMRIDRPFIFAIREHQTGTILFIGKIENPNS